MLRYVAFVRTDVSEEHVASVVMLTRIGELGTTLAVTTRSVFRLLVTANVVPSSAVLVTLMMEAIRSPETSVLSSHLRENHRAYIALTDWAL
jgi:hypothetical protein